MKRAPISLFACPIAACLLLALVASGIPSRAEDGPSSLPDGFVYADEVVPGLVVRLRYAGSDNFLGRPVAGYEGTRAILTRQAADALARVQEELRAFGLGVLVYDAYRPQRAVNDFVRWARDLDDTRTKARYFPRVAKSDLFAEGYIAQRSSHSRGSTVDLTLVVRGEDGAVRELDMGTPWDFFGPESWPTYPGVTPEQRANRLLLRSLMLAHGFEPYAQEWWHFTLKDEPFPDTRFDFVIR